MHKISLIRCATEGYVGYVVGCLVVRCEKAGVSFPMCDCAGRCETAVSLSRDVSVFFSPRGFSAKPFF